MNIQYALLYDQSRCVGCKTCLVACKDWNNVNPGKVSWRKHTVTEQGKLPDFGALGNGERSQFKFFNLTLSCNHCDDPKCVPGCAYGAIVKDPGTGIVLVDRAKCQGLRTCETVCPYQAISHVEDSSNQETADPSWRTPHPAQKCTMCYDRVAVGKQPSCVAGCRTRALDFGTVEYLKNKYGDRLVYEVPGFTRESTGPNIYFIKKEDRVP